MKLLNDVFKDLGFDNYAEFFQSIFLLKNGLVIPLGVAFGLLSSYCEQYFGVGLPIAVAFILFICIEFYTGLAASLKEGNKIQSRKFIKMFIKVAIYLLILASLNALREFNIGLKLVDMPLNLYEIVYYAFFHGIIIQFIISIAENLDRLGYREVAVFRFILNNKIIRKYFNLGERK